MTTFLATIASALVIGVGGWWAFRQFRRWQEHLDAATSSRTVPLDDLLTNSDTDLIRRDRIQRALDGEPEPGTRAARRLAQMQMETERHNDDLRNVLKAFRYNEGGWANVDRDATRAELARIKRREDA